MRSVVAVNAGVIAPLGPDGVASAFVKRSVAAAGVTSAGVAGDQHADALKHGGPEKAVHQYPVEHYAAWRAAGIAAERLENYGAFGENLTSAGMTENDVCIGDVYRVGAAGPVMQVAQTRQPCWKLGLRFDRPDLSAEVQRTGRTGWHYRVLQPGAIAAGDRFTLLERPHADWTLARLIGTLYVRTLDRDALTELASMDALAAALRTLAQRRLERSEVESWRARLTGVRV